MIESTESIACQTHSPDQTLALGRGLGALLQAGDVIGLIGPLGAGKTQLVKGIAAGLGVHGSAVNSPTFIIVNEYDGRLHVFHIDAYRLRGPGELAGLGFEEMYTGGGVLIVEWADRVRDIMPLKTQWIEIEPTGETSRRMIVRSRQAVIARFRSVYKCWSVRTP